MSGQPLPGNDCSTGEMEVRGQNGYLHHIITVFSSPHPHCSWHLFVPQGQQIKVTLYEFAATFMPHLALAASQSLTSQGHGHVMGGRMTCPAYLVLRERGGEETHVCVHSGARQRHVYTAASSELFIRIDTQPQQHDTVNLLVKFEGAQVTVTLMLNNIMSLFLFARWRMQAWMTKQSNDVITVSRVQLWDVPMCQQWSMRG